MSRMGPLQGHISGHSDDTMLLHGAGEGSNELAVARLLQSTTELAWLSGGGPRGNSAGSANEVVALAQELGAEGAGSRASLGETDEALAALKPWLEDAALVAAGGAPCRATLCKVVLICTPRGTES